jgi:hypothetical protein
MKYAIIENNTVINVAVADQPLADNWIASEAAAIGDGYENGQFIKPPPPSVLVPDSVTMRQARLALLQAGLLSSVDAAIDGLPEPDRSAAKIEWEYAAVVQRASGLVPAMGAALGMTEAQIDDLFILAATL